MVLAHNRAQNADNPTDSTSVTGSIVIVPLTNATDTHQDDHSQPNGDVPFVRNIQGRTTTTAQTEWLTNGVAGVVSMF
jgi:hypothetical protein